MEGHALFRWINGAHSPWGDWFFGIISGLGDGLVVALLCALMMLFHLRLGIAAMAAFIVSGLLVQALKRMFDMPRPPAVLDNVHVLGDVLRSHSFPSGHAASDGVMAMAVLLFWGRRDWRAWTAAGAFALAAIGRIYGGVHFPVDVAVGFALGVSAMLVAWRMLGPRIPGAWQQHPRGRKIAGMLAVLMAAVLGLGYSIQPHTAAPLALLFSVGALVLVARVWKVGH